LPPASLVATPSFAGVAALAAVTAPQKSVQVGIVAASTAGFGTQHAVWISEAVAFGSHFLTIAFVASKVVLADVHAFGFRTQESELVSQHSEARHVAPAHSVGNVAFAVM